MSNLKLFIGEKEVAKITPYEIPEPLKGIEWETKGFNLVNAPDRIYSGAAQFYYRRGLVVYFRNVSGRIRAEFPNANSLNEFLRKVKFNSTVEISFTI